MISANDVGSAVVLKTSILHRGQHEKWSQARDAGWLVVGLPVLRTLNTLINRVRSLLFFGFQIFRSGAFL